MRGEFSLTSTQPAVCMIDGRNYTFIIQLIKCYWHFIQTRASTLIINVPGSACCHATYDIYIEIISIHLGKTFRARVGIKVLLKIWILEFVVSVLEVAIGEYGISIDKLVAAAEVLQGDQKSVALTATLRDESKVALFFLETSFLPRFQVPLWQFLYTMSHD